MAGFCICHQCGERFAPFETKLCLECQAKLGETKVSTLTLRQQRIESILEAIDALCKAHAEHAIACNEHRHSDFWPCEKELNDARVDLAETLEENL